MKRHSLLHHVTFPVWLFAMSCAVCVANAAEKPVKVFLLVGQSNMEGKASVSLMEYQAQQPKTASLYARLRDGDAWKVRDDVWVNFLNRRGNLTVGFGSPNQIGPELEFGNVMGDHFEQRVLLIKAAWGGKSLYRDFRPPSSGLPATAVLEKLLERQRKRNPQASLDDVKDSFGFYYRQMLDETRRTLDELSERFPDYEKQGYELGGLVWFQGWNDMVNQDYSAEYTKHMINFIRDVRKDLKQPKLPFVIGQLGVGGTQSDKPNPKRDTFKAAQAAAAEIPEFQGNVAVVKTDAYWDLEADAVFQKGWKSHQEEWKKVGSNYPFHYLGSPKTMIGIGHAFAEALLELSNRGD